MLRGCVRDVLFKMDEHRILCMVEPYVKDNSITYDQFENIFNVLSLKEKYVVTEILYKNGIDLIDAEESIDEETYILDADVDTDDELFHDGNEFSVRYDLGIFKDSDYNSAGQENVVLNKDIKQSNEILCALIQKGNMQATQDLCVKNRRLVDKYAAAYSQRYRHHLDFEDLEQVGFIGLIKAAKRFDIKMGCSFSTYAVWWIKQSISREIMDNGYAIRIPVHMMERINKVVSTSNKYIGYTYKELVQRIAEDLDMSIEAVCECMILKENLLTYSSLNTFVGEDAESELGDYIPSEEEASVEDIVSSHELHRCIEESIESLKEREQQIIRMRFGLDDGIPKTLESIGKMYNVSRERIRQIEAKAIRKLRFPAKSKKLKEFLKD